MGAETFVVSVRREQAHGSIEPTIAAARDGAERYRHEHRSERRRADFGNRALGQLSEHRQRVQIGRLALVDGHADGGVALDVLDRDEVFAHGEIDVRDGHVVLEIQPRAILDARVRCNPAGPVAVR